MHSRCSGPLDISQDYRQDSFDVLQRCHSRSFCSRRAASGKISPSTIEARLPTWKGHVPTLRAGVDARTVATACVLEKGSTRPTSRAHTFVCNLTPPHPFRHHPRVSRTPHTPTPTTPPTPPSAPTPPHSGRRAAQRARVFIRAHSAA